jgi:hypothetical protein
VRKADLQPFVVLVGLVNSSSLRIPERHLGVSTTTCPPQFFNRHDLTILYLTFRGFFVFFFAIPSVLQSI